MATLDVKFTKFDNRPWGFRLAGGSDFPQPLTVIRVSEGSLAECMGLKVGDVVVKLNDQPVHELTHGQAHEALVLAGNNYVLGVRRTEDPNTAIEGIEENIEPYMLPIEEILFAPIEEKKESTPDEVPQIEDECELPAEPAAERDESELYPEKPRDENSEVVPNKNLTDEEIALLILDEEEVLNEKGVLGVNFKKLRPRAPLFKESKVFQELQQEENSEPAQVQELKRQTTFLQKPERPVPKPQDSANTEPEVEPYRVVIKKQPKKSVTERLLQKGLLEPSRVKTPEPTAEVNEPDHLLENVDLESVSDVPPRGTWSYTSCVLLDADEFLLVPPTEILVTEVADDANMLPINEGSEEFSTPSSFVYEPCEPESCVITERIQVPITKPPVSTTYDPMPSFVPIERVRQQPRLCRRGRYAKRCLSRALESLKPSADDKNKKPRLLRRGHYFERIVRDIKRTVSGEKEASRDDNFLRVIMLTSLAYSLRDTYDTEILHRGSSRRNSRRMSSCRRESNAANLNPYEAGLLAFKANNEAESLTSFQSKCAEGRRRLSVISMVVAEKVSSAMRTDLARGLAYALVPCASALAFFMFNYVKRYNNDE